jgi:hypothetical protein
MREPTRRRQALPALILAFAVACADPGVRVPADSSADLASSTGLQTSDTVYTLARDGIMERTAIAFRYRNARPTPLFHPTCRPSGGEPTVAISIEKLVGGEWRHAWSQPLPACLSEPIVIASGDTYADTLHVILHPQDSVINTWLVPAAPLGGQYRLVWHQLLTSYAPNDYPFGEELPLDERVSQPFQLRR